MKNIFMDTNVVIDFLANRQPFAMDAAKIFDMAEKGTARIFIAAVSYNNIYYVLRQFIPAKAVLALLEELADISVIADVTETVIRLAIKTDFTDYEDAIQYNTALSISGVDCIVTRNTKDFKKSKIAVFTPTELLAAMGT